MKLACEETMTRGFLKSLGVADEAIERIIQSHIETVDGLKKELAGWKAQAEGVEALTQERDALQARLAGAEEAAQVRAAFEAYKQQAEAEKTRMAKEAALRRALREAGVRREGFEELLMRSIDPESLALAEGQEGRLQEEAALIQSLREKYGGCFAAPRVQGTLPTEPPTGAKALTREQIMQMSPQEINNNWSAIRETLAHF